MPTRTQPENPSAFKHWINEALLKRMSDAISSAYPSFDRRSFLRVARRLAPLEMKDRVRLVRDELRAHLPGDYVPALEILVRSLRLGSLKGFDLWPYTEFVQTYGLGHFEESMRALYELTQKFTGEFAVRPFIIQDQTKTLRKLEAWTEDESEHVRRWISEGTRPRLPWGEKLRALISDPKPGLRLLEKLKYDESLYVRKSIANHLNDITKDHPRLVVETLTRWKSGAPTLHQAKIDWIIRRALRTLIKAGDNGALLLCGVKTGAKVEVENLRLHKKSLRFPDVLEFSFEVISKAATPQKLVIDYVIHHCKARGEPVPKVFKLRNVELPGKARLELKKKHPIKKITTRKYYPGEHVLEIQINGKILGRAEWKLSL